MPFLKPCSLHRLMTKRIRIFHPRKLWLSIALFIFTVGVGIGEMQFSHQSESVAFAPKMSLSLQTSTFANYLSGPKQGLMRANHYTVSFLNPKEAHENPLTSEHPAKEGIPRYCFWEDLTDDPVYSFEVVEVKMPESILPGEAFRVELNIKNNGNRIWYNPDNGCDEAKTVVNLGTQKAQDRASVFYQKGDQTGWLGTNRIQMLDDVVTPDRTGNFIFSAIAPEHFDGNIYREYFNLVAENITWFPEELTFPLDIRIGNVTEADEHRLKFLYRDSKDTRSLSEDQNIEVDLSEQKLRLKFGDYVAYEMTVSTGARKTPTPTGNFKILNKQELRRGGEWPHYMMPQWMGFTKWGHGLHALPYLQSDGGVFWSEALNHIGIPVSHGCIRQLPEDSVIVYEFGTVGMPITIHP